MIGVLRVQSHFSDSEDFLLDFNWKLRVQKFKNHFNKKNLKIFKYLIQKLYLTFYKSPTFTLNLHQSLSNFESINTQNMSPRPKLTAKPLSDFPKARYNTVRILSIQECDNKVKIIKMVRRKRPRLLPSLNSTIKIDISDDEDKENVIEISDSEDEKSSLTISETTSLSDSKNIFMQDLLTEFKSDQKSPKNIFMENLNLKLPENDKNNNLPLTPPESEKSTPSGYLPKLKCHRTCFLSKTHQKKHRADISSEIGILLTKKDLIDENYRKNSLRKIEENSKAPKVDKFDKFIHVTRNGKVLKSPKGKFGRKIQPSEILAAMKEAGSERKIITRWGMKKY